MQFAWCISNDRCRVRACESRDSHRYDVLGSIMPPYDGDVWLGYMTPSPPKLLAVLEEVGFLNGFAKGGLTAPVRAARAGVQAEQGDAAQGGVPVWRQGRRRAQERQGPHAQAGQQAQRAAAQDPGMGPLVRSFSICPGRASSSLASTLQQGSLILRLACWVLMKQPCSAQGHCLGAEGNFKKKSSSLTDNQLCYALLRWVNLVLHCAGGAGEGRARLQQGVCAGCRRRQRWQGCRRRPSQEAPDLVAALYCAPFQSVERVSVSFLTVRL